VQTRATLPVLRRLTAISTAIAAASVSADGQQIPDLPAIRVESVYRLQSPSISSSFPITRLDDGQASGDLDRVSAGTLTFAQPLPVRDVLFMLFRGTPFSIVFDPAVGGAFTGELTDLTLRQALEAVLVPAGLDFQRRGRVVHVFPRRAETRLFEVSVVDAARSWRRRTGANEGDGSGELTATVAADFFGELTSGIQSLLSGSGRMHLDRTAGVVQVTDFAERLQQVGIYIEAVTLRATRQVRLSARVLDVALTDQQAIDWTAVAKNAGVAIGPGAGIHVSDFDGLVGAIGAFGAVRTIAAPQILAMNNQPATMRIGAALGAAFTGGDPPPLPSTFALSITPQIGADGIVHMTVSPAYADEARGRSSRQVTEADSVMRVRGGDTVVIAGLTREWSDAAPAGRTPGAGNQIRMRRELVVLLTPTVVSAGVAPASGAQ
jgi:type II secretory pathway component GspD/PulD (secretin)